MNGKHDAAAKAGGKRRILIVDDHPLYREGLAQFVDQTGDLKVCGEADSTIEALDSINKLKPDLVTIDVTLRDSSGIDLVKLVKSQHPKLPILVVSMHPESLYAERALAAGARGYISKEAATAQILEAVRSVFAGKIYLSDEMTQRMLEKKTQGLPETTSSIELLSDRELEVFELIGAGRTTDKIAQSLNLSTKTIETYRANIKAKLNLRNNTELIQHAVQWVQSGKQI